MPVSIASPVHFAARTGAPATHRADAVRFAGTTAATPDNDKKEQPSHNAHDEPERAHGLINHIQLAAANFLSFQKHHWKQGGFGKALAAYDLAICIAGLVPGFHFLWVLAPSPWSMLNALLSGKPNKYVEPEFVQKMNQSSARPRHKKNDNTGEIDANPAVADTHPATPDHYPPPHEPDHSIDDNFDID